MGSPKRIQGLIINIDKNHVSRNLRSMNFKVWSGSGLPENVIYEKIVPLPSLIADTLNFIEFDSIIQANSEFYAGYELNYNTPLDTFSAYMAYNRYTGGISTAFVNNGIEWNSLSEFTNGTVNSSFAVFPVVYESLPIIKEPEFEENAIAYPNPASSIIRIQLREMSDEAVRISMYNVQGQLIFEDKYKPFQHIIPLPLNGISNGIYLIKVKQGNRTADLKVAVIK